MVCLYMCVCVGVCVCVCVCVACALRVRVCLRARTRAFVCVALIHIYVCIRLQIQSKIYISCKSITNKVPVEILSLVKWLLSLTMRCSLYLTVLHTFGYIMFTNNYKDLTKVFAHCAMGCHFFLLEFRIIIFLRPDLLNQDV